MPEVLIYQCPFCNCEVRVGSSCPGCAKRHRRPPTVPAGKSWQQDAAADGLDLPDSDFDYDEYVAREFGHLPHRRLGVPWYWWLLALMALIALIISWPRFY